MIAKRCRAVVSVALFLSPFVAAFGMAYYHLHAA